jgi:hypothetical protein
VKLHGLPANLYAENGEEQTSIYPVFVKIIKSTLPNITKLQDEANRISIAVANIVERPAENVHVIFEPDGTGRVAFGGKLLTE